MANLVIEASNAMPKKSRKVVRAILGSLKQGATTKAACEAAGINETTFWRWRRRHPRLEAVVEAIKESRIEQVEDALFKNCLDGNTSAQMFFLTRRKPEKWPDRSLIVNNVINNKQENGKNDDREFTGSDAAEQGRLDQFFRDAAK